MLRELYTWLKQLLYVPMLQAPALADQRAILSCLPCVATVSLTPRPHVPALPPPPLPLRPLPLLRLLPLLPPLRALPAVALCTWHSSPCTALLGTWRHSSPSSLACGRHKSRQCVWAACEQRVSSVRAACEQGGVPPSEGRPAQLAIELSSHSAQSQEAVPSSAGNALSGPPPHCTALRLAPYFGLTRG